MLQDTKLRRSNTENIQQILKKVEKKVQIIYSDFPNKIRQKKKELALEEQKLTNFINFIGEGKGTRSLNQALVDSENNNDDLKDEIHVLQNTNAKAIKTLPIQWVENRLINIQTTLEQKVTQSALVLRKLLESIELEAVVPELGRPCCIAHTTLDALSIFDKRIAPHHSKKGANQFDWRSLGESNPCCRLERPMS